MTSEPRSVLFCIYSHNVQGGIEVWQRRMLKAFRAAGWKTTLGLARGKRFNRPEPFRRAMDEGSIVTFDGRTGTDEGRILAIQKVVDRLKPRVVVTSGLAHVLPAIGRLKASGCDIRLVYAIHATSASILADPLGFSAVLDAAVGVNPLHARFLESRGFTGRVAMIPYGSDAPARVQCGRKNPDEITLLFAGRFHQESKNVLHAVALAKELARRRVPFRFLMAGAGPDESRVRDAICESGLESHFELLGWLDQAAMHERVFPRADVLLLFSPSEGNPLVLGEALAHGVVPITTPFIGLRSLSWFREGQNALTFPLGDIERLAETLQQLESDSERLARMSYSCRETGRSISWERCENDWIELLNDLDREPAVMPSADFPMSRPAAAGRLDAIGLGAHRVDTIRRFFRRFPDFDDGWGEWPGTLGLASGAEAERMWNELGALDAT